MHKKTPFSRAFKTLAAGAITVFTILGANTAFAGLKLEKEELKFGFIKLTDMAPLAIAYEKGFFEDEGLFVTLEAQANWKVLLDRTIDGELDGERVTEVEEASVVAFGAVVVVAVALTAMGRENDTPRPTESAATAINKQLITMNTLVRLCFHHGSSGSRGVASYTVSRCPPGVTAGTSGGEMSTTAV